MPQNSCIPLLGWWHYDVLMLIYPTSLRGPKLIFDLYSGGCHVPTEFLSFWYLAVSCNSLLFLAVFFLILCCFWPIFINFAVFEVLSQKARSYCRIWSDLAGFGHIWSYLVIFGQTRSDSIGFDRIRSDLVEFGRIWSHLVGFCWIWLDTVGFCRIWSHSVGFGWIWSDLVGFGRIWLDLVGFGRILSDSVGSFGVAPGRDLIKYYTSAEVHLKGLFWNEMSGKFPNIILLLTVPCRLLDHSMVE